MARSMTIARSSKWIIPCIISRCEGYAKASQATPFNAVHDMLSAYYNYTKEQYNGDIDITHDEYLELFYKVILDYDVLIYQPYLYCMDAYHRFGGHPTEYSESFFNEVKQQIEKELEQLTKRNEELQQLNKILEHQQVLDTLQRIEPLMDLYKVKECDDIFLYAALFNYGYIEGKRAERTKHKINLQEVHTT